MNHDLPAMAAVAPARDEFGRLPRPAHDPMFEVVAQAIPFAHLKPEYIVPMRERPGFENAETQRARFSVEHRELVVPGYGGADLTLSVFRRTGDESVGPGFFYIHGGGMVGGDRFGGTSVFLTQLAAYGGTVMSIEYRLAPEHPAPTPVEDCYAALAWVAEHAAELQFDPARLILGGTSAGGGLAAGTMLLARDRRGPELLGVLLECPMLDDRNNSTSIQQFWGVLGAWSGISNEVGWNALLGDARGSDAVSPYDAPARAAWLGGLPPIHIGIGSTDPFRDENVAFASAVWRDGGNCELLVVPGGPHGFEMLGEAMSISREMLRSRQEWVARQLNPDSPEAATEFLQKLAQYFEA